MRFVAATPDFAQLLADLGMPTKTMTPQVFAEQLRAETGQWRSDIRKIGFTAES